MPAQSNLTRTLKLIRLLKQRPGKTLAQLSQLLDCHPRHARRYMATPLRQKIYRHSTLLPVAGNLVNQHRSLVVARLAEAVRDRRQVQLLRYYSANSNTSSTRLVEPYGFSDQYTQLMAYEPESVTVKTFKIQRIEAVTVLDTAQLCPPTEVPTDLFDWPGDPVPIALRLTPMAIHQQPQSG